MQVLSERWLIPPYGVPVWVHLEFTHLFVPLRQVAKILTLGFSQINLENRSLIRTFAAKSTLNLWKSRINLPRN